MAGATDGAYCEGQDELEQLAATFLPRASKLRPARSSLELVERSQLVGTLLESPAPLIVVSAPAGYGKSILLAQWADAAPVPAAWLQLDVTDNDPVVFLSYLTEALSRVAPVDPTIADLLRVPSPPIDELILPRLGEALEAAQPFLLILDDAHLLQSAACWGHLAALLEQLPPGAHLAVGTRSEAPLPIARLRADGRVAELRLADLRLTRAEAHELLRLRGAEADDEALDGLLELTEGWATGLYLALLAGRGRPAAEWLPHLHGDLHVIASYLTAEVLEHQSPGLQEFLLRTSILDQLSPGLCRAVTEDDRAHDHLTRLARENLFVMALDDHDEWYRYHHLFAELLAAQLERRDPNEVPRLHARAAAWYQQHEDLGRAVRHWVAAGDIAAAASPTFAAAQGYVFRGEVESARRLLDAFTDEELSSHVALTMTAGWLYGTVIGDPTKGERWRRAACSVATGDERMPGDLGSWRAYQLALRAFLAPDGISRMLEDAESSAACRQRDSEAAIESQRVLGVATYLNGAPRRASRAFQEVVGDSTDPATRSYALAFLSLIAADEGRSDDAGELDRRALELTPGMTLDVSPGMYLALPMMLAHARVLAARDDPDWRAQVKSCALHLSSMVPQVPWRILLTCVVLGEISVQRDESADADLWVARAEAQLRASPDAGILRGRVLRLREALEQRRLTQPLTAAERRVLDLLPTQLSAPQIAARLFVSGNTVKTHTSHLYAKLGVTTRTAAVERARDLGLLRPPEQNS
jgi:LuxR family transcriptional regulator, maltose regulon positive regulatory protein